MFELTSSWTVAYKPKFICTAPQMNEILVTCLFIYWIDILYGCYLKCEQEIQWEHRRSMRLTGREWAPSQHTGGFRGQTLIDTLIEKNKNKQKHVWAICQPLLDPNPFHHQRCCDISVPLLSTLHRVQAKSTLGVQVEREALIKGKDSHARNKEEMGIFLSVMNMTMSRTQQRDHSSV